MGGVAQQRDAALGPVLHRLAVAQHPHPPRLDALEQAQHLGTLALEAVKQLVGIALGVPALDVAVGVEHGDEVVERAAAQRVMHEVGFRPGPQHDVRAPQVVRHLLAPEHGAIGDMPGHPRRAVADHPAAHLRPHAVAADQRAAAHLVAVFEPQRNARRLRRRSRRPCGWSQARRGCALARPQIDAVNVGAMGHRVGLAEARAERLAERDRR